MNDFFFYSEAKLNLFFKIIGFDNISNYHYIHSFVKKINFYDEINININNQIDNYKINFIYGEWFKKFIEYNKNTHFAINKLDEKNNSISNSIKIFEKISGLHVKNLDIICKKNIPYGSGLAGGSSNASAILKFLQKYYNYNINISDYKKEILNALGADSFIFLYDQKNKDEKNNQSEYIFFVSEFGQKIENIKINFSFKKLFVLIFYPFKINDTKILYNRYSQENLNLYKNNNFFLDENNIEKNNFILEERNFNSFENIIDENEKNISNNFFNHIKNLKGFISFGLSGSGSCYYAIIDDENLYQNISKDYKEFILGIFRFI
jgi:4-diphosphocytidyl-2-C-methyl-D-erythritol kinase